MLRIDCLLTNTDAKELARDVIKYLGHKGIADGTDVSFKSIFNRMRKEGIEIDAESAAHIYAKELPTDDARFTKEEDLKYSTGKWFKDIVRNITLQKPKKGEKEIGELSPAQAVAKHYADAFTNNVVSDETTKSILKTLEDIYKKAGQRLLGDLPNEKAKKEDPRSVSEIIQQALDNENIGLKDNATGTINGLAKMHEEVKRLIGEMTKHMEETGDIDKIEQWENYAKSLEESSYQLMFESKEAKTILHESLMDKGFVKTLKDGTQVLDWRKLAGNINSYTQIRDNVVSALTDRGFTPDVANRVADSLQQEFRDMRGKIMEVSDKNLKSIADTWNTASNPTPKETLKELVERRIKDWRNNQAFPETTPKQLTFTKNESKYILADALRNSDQFGRGDKTKSIDWQELASGKPSESELKQIVQDYLKKEGISDTDAFRTREALKTTYSDLDQAIKDHSKSILDRQQSVLDRESGVRKSELTRLAELHDLGIFDGAHDKLLANVLGLEAHDHQAMQDIKQFAGQMSKLRQLMQGNDFLVPSIQRQVAHEITQIVARNVENKTKMLKVMSSLNKVYQVENSSLVSGYRNLLENHLSGLIEYATTKSSLRMKLGADLTKNKASLRQLMADTWSVISKGGNEFGLAPYQVGGTQLRLSDKYNLNQMRGEDWHSPKTWAKGVASAVLTIPRAFLSGTDGMFKTALYRLHFLSNMHDALVSTGNYTHDEAIEFINDSIYGPGQLDKARVKAKDLYDQAGISYISQKEINIAANELLHENLLQGHDVTPEMIQEVQHSAFHQAGLGMGHESNNYISERIQSSKLSMQRKEQDAFTKGDYRKAAQMRMLNTAVNSIALRFAASQANWAWIRIQQSGIGIISGIYHYKLGDAIKGTDLLDTEKLKEQAKEYQIARQHMARGILGLAANALLTSVVLPALAKALNPDSEDPEQAMFDKMGDNYLAKALFIKLSPVWGLADYFYHTAKSKTGGDETARLLSATGDLIQNVTNFGDSHSLPAQFAEAIKDFHSSNKKSIMKGETTLGKIVGNLIPHVPFYKSTKDALVTFDYFNSGKQPMYNFPYGFMAGAFGGGMIEDLGWLPSKDISGLPYVGKNELPYFDADNIHTVEDLHKRYPNDEDAARYIEARLPSGKASETAIKAYKAALHEKQ